MCCVMCVWSGTAIVSLVVLVFCFFFFNDTATTEIYTLSLHDALPILRSSTFAGKNGRPPVSCASVRLRSEEHTSELQSRSDLVCRLLLEKKKNKNKSGAKVEITGEGCVTVTHPLNVLLYSHLRSPFFFFFFFFFNDTATTEIYTLSLHDALPIWSVRLFRWSWKVPRRDRPQMWVNPRKRKVSSL